MATFVVIPGAGGDAWYWHRVVPGLEDKGHEAIAVQLPAGDDSAGWAEYADAIEQAIGNRRDLVLVAQSLAGFSAPLVCARRRVELLVLLNAMIPMPGETGEAWGSNTHPQEAQQAYFAQIGLQPQAAEEETIVYFHDVPSEVSDEAHRRGEPDQSWTPMTEPWPLNAWPEVPTRALAGRQDRLFSLQFQRRVARERLGIEVDEIDGGHLVALSRPGELVDRLDRYLRDVQPRLSRSVHRERR